MKVTLISYSGLSIFLNNREKQVIKRSDQMALLCRIKLGVWSIVEINRPTTCL